jgi:hypothetical protein
VGAREDDFDVGALGAWTMPRGSARMALLRVSYVLLCAVAGVDIMLDIMIAEYMYTAKSPVVCISRCQTASSKAEAARAGCWRGHELHLHLLLSHPRLYQATRCHQRTRPRRLRTPITIYGCFANIYTVPSLIMRALNASNDRQATSWRLCQS